MKTFSFKNLLFLPFVALIATAFLGAGSQAFADDAYYTGNYTPAGCNANAMTVVYLDTGTFVPADFTGNTIYVFDQGAYAINTVVNFFGSCI